MERNVYMSRLTHCIFCLPLCVVSIFSLAGCGGADLPELGEVTGTVTLNGQPVEGALVEFIPDSGRPSSGVTDAEGVYTLTYTAEASGAVTGTHTVNITTARAQQGGEGDEPLVEARPETIPQAYNDETTLSVEVEAGSNTHDFVLEGERGPESNGYIDPA